MIDLRTSREAANTTLDVAVSFLNQNGIDQIIDVYNNIYLNQNVKKNLQPVVDAYNFVNNFDVNKVKYYNNVRFDEYFRAFIEKCILIKNVGLKTDFLNEKLTQMETLNNKKITDLHRKYENVQDIEIKKKLNMAISTQELLNSKIKLNSTRPPIAHVNGEIYRERIKPNAAAEMQDAVQTYESTKGNDPDFKELNPIESSAKKSKDPKKDEIKELIKKAKEAPDNKKQLLDSAKEEYKMKLPRRMLGALSNGLVDSYKSSIEKREKDKANSVVYDDNHNVLTEGAKEVYLERARNLAFEESEKEAREWAEKKVQDKHDKNPDLDVKLDEIAMRKKQLKIYEDKLKIYKKLQRNNTIKSTLACIRHPLGSLPKGLMEKLQDVATDYRSYNADVYQIENGTFDYTADELAAEQEEASMGSR